MSKYHLQVVKSMERHLGLIGAIFAMYFILLRKVTRDSACMGTIRKIYNDGICHDNICQTSDILMQPHVSRLMLN